MIAGIAVVTVEMLLIILPTAVSGSPPAGDTYAIIIMGIGKDPQDRLARDQVIRDFRGYLLDKASVRPERLVVLLPDANGPSVSTAKGIEDAVDAIASTAGPADRFILYYIGQANAVGDGLRFNLPGPDVTQEDLAKWLAGVKADTQLVVLDCPCAAMAAKALVRRGRVLLLASTETQAHAPRFGLHFVPALTRAENDTNHDGAVSVLEAFTAAARGIEQWYQQRQILPTETPCLEDDGDGRPGERPWRYEQDGGDGRLAAELSLAPGV